MLHIIAWISGESITEALQMVASVYVPTARARMWVRSLGLHGHHCHNGPAARSTYLLDIADLGGAAIESSDTLTGVDPLVTVPLVP